MRKISLCLDDLQVETFATLPDRRGAGGTVHANEYTTPQECPSVETGDPNGLCFGCDNSGVASCVRCPGRSVTCVDCSWTDGDGAVCAW